MKHDETSFWDGLFSGLCCYASFREGISWYLIISHAATEDLVMPRTVPRISATWPQFASGHPWALLAQKRVDLLDGNLHEICRFFVFISSRFQYSRKVWWYKAQFPCSFPPFKYKQRKTIEEPRATNITKWPPTDSCDGTEGSRV